LEGRSNQEIIEERGSKESIEQFRLLMKASALERVDAKFHGYGTFHHARWRDSSESSEGTTMKYKTAWLGLWPLLIFVIVPFTDAGKWWCFLAGLLSGVTLLRFAMTQPPRLTRKELLKLRFKQDL
jgi:hypothetical protein